MLRPIDVALLWAGTRVPSSFRSARLRRLRRLSAGDCPAAVQRRPAPDWCCRRNTQDRTAHHCRAKSASMSAAADAVFAAVFAVLVAVAVWPARCTVAVKRGACGGPSVRISHSGGA